MDKKKKSILPIDKIISLPNEVSGSSNDLIDGKIERYPEPGEIRDANIKIIMKPLLELLEDKMMIETGFNYIFRTRWLSQRSNKVEYHIVSPEGSDDGFHLFRSCTFGIQWFTDPAEAVNRFLEEHFQWLEHQSRMRAQQNNKASLPVSTWPHPGNAGSDLLP